MNKCPECQRELTKVGLSNRYRCTNPPCPVVFARGDIKYSDPQKELIKTAIVRYFNYDADLAECDDLVNDICGILGTGR